MRAALETRLNDIWYREDEPPWYLRVLTPLYRLLLRWDQRRQRASRADDLDGKCIVVVGNLTAGGSGKTPLVIRICELLNAAGLKPGVVSRGYGRNDNKQRLVVAGSNPELVGDEPLLIARRTGVPVIVGPDRSDSARDLFSRGVDVVVSDDGLQHVALPRVVEICVVDGARGFGNGWLLPAGPLREGPERLSSVDFVIVNGGGPDWPRGLSGTEGLNLVRMEVYARKVYSMGEKLSWRLSQFNGCKVNAVAGIANPDRFFELLRHSGIEVLEKVFPDHHNFESADFEGLEKNLPIIMTEKDAVKCREISLPNAWYLSVDAQLPAHWEQALLRAIREHAGER